MTGKVAEVSETSDFILSIGPTRSLVCKSGTVVMRDGAGMRWSSAIAPGRVVDAVVILDGRAAALHVEGRQARDVIVVIDLRDGRLERRITLENAVVRFAARAALALAIVESKRVLLIDLRLGRVIANREIDRGIVRASINDAGDEVELWTSDGDALPMRVGVRALAHLQPTEPEPDPEPEAHIEPEPQAQPAAETQPLIEIPRSPWSIDIPLIRTLPPRPHLEPATHDEIGRLLDAYRERSRALAAYAIARAWDDGRVAFEGSALPHHAEVAGLLGGTRGRAVDEVDAGADRLSRTIAKCAQVEAAIVPRWAPLSAIAVELGLSPLAQEIVIAIAAPMIWGDVRRLYKLLAGHDRCDVHLLSTLLASLASAEAIASELEANAPLVHLGIVRGEDHLTIDHVVLRMLRTPSDPPAVVRTLAELHIRTEIVEQALRDLALAPHPLRIVVRGRTGSGRRSLVAAIVHATGRELAVVDAAPLLRDPKTCARELRHALQRVHLARRVPCVTGLDRVEDERVRDELREILREHRGPIVVRHARDVTPMIEGERVAIDLPVQTPTERRATWSASLARHPHADVHTLADRYAITPGVVERVVASTPLDADSAAIDRAVRKHVDTQLGAIATRVERLATWEQVVLPQDIADSVRELIGRIRHRATVFDAWGFDRVMTTSRGVTALFQGGPGTGKTLVAGAIARELGLDLYRVDVSRIMSKWLGETEQNLAKLFDAAEESNAIILFDEADSLFARRTEVKSSNDRYANVEVNYLLQRLDSFEGIAILTTNFGSSIDSAFKRRLSFRLTLPFPDEDQRERLWRAHIPDAAPVASGVDLTEIARRFQLSGGYIRNCMLRAAFLAAEQGGMLTATHLEHAIRAEFREIGKLAETGALE